MKKRRRRRRMIACEHALQGTLVTPLERPGEFARRLDDVNEDDHGNNDKNTRSPFCFTRVYPTLSISFN